MEKMMGKWVWDAKRRTVVPGQSAYAQVERQVQVERKSSWGSLNGLEKAGVVALGLAAGGVAIVALAPALAAASVGGALAGAGAFLVKKGMKGS